MKDPAFLMFYRDFLTDTELWPDEITGKWARLIMHLVDKNRLSGLDVLRLCNGVIPDQIKQKLSEDENGFYSQWLEKTQEKRKRYIENRLLNLKEKRKNKPSFTPYGEPHKEAPYGEPHTVNANANANENAVFTGKKLTPQQVNEQLPF